MPFCPQCRTEYRPQYTQCSDCGEWLVAVLPEASTLEEEEAGQQTIHLVKLAEFLTPVESEMLRELLQQNGIEVVVRGYADAISPLHGVTVLVAEPHLQRAIELYEAFFGEFDREDEPMGFDEEPYQ